MWQKEVDPLRNKIELQLPPDALFLNPWADPGFSVLWQPEFIWRPMPRAVIEGFAASAHEEINRKITSFLSVTKKQKVFREALEFNAVPALLEQASFRKSYVMASDRLLLSGAAGTRLINRYRWENEDADPAVDITLEAFLAGCREANEARQLPVISDVLDPEMPFAVECRNTFNFYHFLTEALPQLTVLDGLAFQGDIYFHFPNSEEKHRPFTEAFVEALFPEYAGRVFFERAPKEYARVLTAYDFNGGHAQMPEKMLDGIMSFAPPGLVEDEDWLNTRHNATLAMNSVSSMLLALRSRALAAIEGEEFPHLPKRFFVGRDSRQSRERHMAGEDLLFEHLSLFGFEYVVFENLHPIEQIALMARAEVMISYHGAGFANMLFADPGAYVIEIGTLQTAQFRWGDFWPLAHASQCRYINFFADFNTEDPLSEPHFSKDGIVPVALSERAVAQIMAFVVSVLGHVPELKSVDAVGRLARELLQAGAADRAVAVLEKHAKLVIEDVELCLLQADCHKELDEPKSELVALDKAFKADTARWRTLIRIIWCANRVERPQVIRWALSRLKSDFPERHDAFVKNHEWVRYVA
ncbi:hypothetical protein FIU94_05395 [Sulfitobacter sp. THAF37]|uniref:glycosyltransferase 61 family protein n=1 Tax=Sulfitobacter sp. THAF37 TaxID=2587855 RepID=UPI001268FC39|nr:glycosyltransferase family 61 protein [Sulfitobacter sp. THAF37]QFT58253.1 hypothetical protein FIU94_05395 [Sulfitobacter sp. THAF37]